jgi:hypothetical protein
MKVYAEYGHASPRRANTVHELMQRLGGERLSMQAPIPGNCDLFLRWGMRNTPDMYAALRRGTTVVCLDRSYFDATRLNRFSISVQGVHGLSQRLDNVAPPAPRASAVEIRRRIHPDMCSRLVAGSLALAFRPASRGVGNADGRSS